VWGVALGGVLCLDGDLREDARPLGIGQKPAVLVGPSDEHLRRIAGDSHGLLEHGCAGFGTRTTRLRGHQDRTDLTRLRRHRLAAEGGDFRPQLGVDLRRGLERSRQLGDLGFEGLGVSLPCTDSARSSGEDRACDERFGLRLLGRDAVVPRREREAPVPRLGGRQCGFELKRRHGDSPPTRASILP
jgi:hypothetical protein